jgi:hypothetical protein
MESWWEIQRNFLLVFHIISIVLPGYAKQAYRVILGLSIR